jgi:hypothetical protein
MPETAGTAIRIDFISVEFVHFTDTMYLSCVKHNLIPYTQDIEPPTTTGLDYQGPSCMRKLIKDMYAGVL